MTRWCRAPRSAALAAALTALALLAAGCGGGSDQGLPGSPTSTGSPMSTLAQSATTAPGGPTGTGPGPTGSTGPTATGAPPTTTSAPSYRQFGAAVSVTRGFVVGASPDGSAVYVERLDDRLSQLGCEGEPEPVIFRVPLGGGEAAPVLAGGKPVRGQVVRGPDRRVALVVSCEGFLQTVRTGSETADGHLADLNEVPIESTDELEGFTWSADGQRLLAAQNDFLAGVVRAVALDPRTGAVSTLFELPQATFATAVARLADGSYAVAADGQVSLRSSSGAVLMSTTGFGFAVSPDRSRAMAFGPGLALLVPGGTEPRVFGTTAEGGTVLDASFSPDGRAVAFTVTSAAADVLRVLTLADGLVADAPAQAGRVVRPTFTGDGRSLVFSLVASGPAEPTVIRLPFGG